MPKPVYVNLKNVQKKRMQSFNPGAPLNDEYSSNINSNATFSTNMPTKHQSEFHLKVSSANAEQLVNPAISRDKMMATLQQKSDRKILFS